MDKSDNQLKTWKKKSMKSSGSADVVTQCVQVVVRCRPMDEKELARGYMRVVDVFPSRGVVEIRHPRDDPSSDNVKVFTFDAVYD